MTELRSLPRTDAPEKRSPAASRRGDTLRKASVAIGCVALFLVFSVLNGTFYRPSNLIDIMLQSSINAVIAVGMTLVIMTKGIDLSVGSIVGLSSMVAADMLSHGLLAGIGAGLLVGLVCGFLNGVLIAKLKLPDFIVTLGTLSIFRGAALIYTDGQPIYGLAKEFRAIFAGRLLDIPTPVLLALAIAALAYLLVRYTALGEQIIAIGGNEEAARLSGINIERAKVTVYTISGVLSSLAGFVLIARIGAAEPIGGSGFELQAIGSAVIGGASLFGGVGNPLGSLIGALTLGALQNGLTLMNVPSFWQYVASGAVVILAVFADQWTRKRG
ncbi:ribose transport system permease protein [Mesorhizobium sp. NFR06]|uniref:ABC transporter permease n=1 Tax=Mesorhizobium sp. NFR06 TaxID=1566290 RepID=UPI0008F2391C|nr:ABC transporter permease [Mesorhizobium sp. NFR06]SFQ08917.1 ribose transport system permease protein [Mesorhizobium sp. NFR06]